MAVKEVGNITSEPQVDSLRVQNATDTGKKVDLTVTDNEHFLVDGDVTTFYQIIRGNTTGGILLQTATNGSLDGPGNGGGLAVRLTNNNASLWLYPSSGGSTGTFVIGNGGSTGVTIDASRNATFVANLATNGAVTLGDASDDDHILNGTLRLASEHSSGPSAPADGAGGILYVKDDGKLYFISEDVTETDLTAGGGGDLTITTASSATYSATTYNTMYIIDSSSNAVEVDLPTASGNAGKTIDVLAKTGSTNAVTVDPNEDETINGSSASYVLNTNFSNITLVSDGSNWVIR